MVPPIGGLADIDAAEQRLAARCELGAEGGHAVEVRPGLDLGGALVRVRVRIRVRVRVRVRIGLRLGLGSGRGSELRQAPKIQPSPSP